jgi:hypothetical protein
MKKLLKFSPALLVAAGLLAGASAFAHNGEDHSKEKAPAEQTPSDSIAKAKAAYPLSTCVVSGDKLEGGDMGEAIDYVHKETGKPDRLVRLCCKKCIRDFKKDPAKYLKMIDDASAKGAPEAGHAEHKH